MSTVQRQQLEAGILALEAQRAPLAEAVVDAAVAGLARVALAEGDTDAALATLQPLLDHVAASGTFDGNSDSRWIELTAHQVLARARDPRAAEWLVRAHTALMTRADAISDAELRKGFLHNIPFHREIVAAWAHWAACAEGTTATTAG
ncbi:MAG: hypothetical protein V4844_02800 [Pseudomonadota bacterium]